MNHYDVLGIKKTASQEEIKKAYKELVKKYHPDVYKGDKTFAEKKTAQINGAYDVLSNPETRQAYDEEISPRVKYSYTPPYYTSSYDQYKDKYKNTYSYRYNVNVRDGSEHDYYTYVNYHRDKQEKNYNNYTKKSSFSEKIVQKVDKLDKKVQKYIIIVIVAIYILLLIFSIVEFNSIMNPKTPDFTYSSQNEVTNTQEQTEYTNKFENNTITTQKGNLYDYFSDEELQNIYSQIVPTLDNEITYEEFLKILANYFNLSY